MAARRGIGRFRPARASWAAWPYFAFCAMLVGIYYGAGADHPRLQGAIYQTASASCVVAVVVGLRRNLGRPHLSWRLFAIGIGCWSLGDLVWLLTDAFGVSAIPARLADAVHLAAYLPFGGGLLLFAAGGEALARVVRQLLDAAIVFLAALAFLWYLAIDRVVDTAGLGRIDLAVSIAYPVGDLLLFALLMRLLFVNERWPASYRLLAGAFASVFVGDLLWRAMVARGTYSLGSSINLFFVLAYALWGAAALHPSVAGVAAVARRGERERVLSRRRLSLLGLAATTPGAVLLAGAPMGSTENRLLYAALVTAIPLLTLIRTGDVVRALRDAVAEAEEARADLTAVVDACPVPICVVDEHRTIHVWNHAAELSSGFSAQEAIGKKSPVTVTPDSARVVEFYERTFAGSPVRGVDVTLRNRSGAPRDVRFSTALLADGSRVVVLFEDVTEELRRSETIAFLAAHDPLTGLANRRTFEEQLQLALSEATSRPAALVLLDLDNFKLVNDSGGHETGDKLLVELTKRLQTRLRPHDTLARLSGDEFAIILTGTDAAGATRIAERLLDEARRYRLISPAGIFDTTLSAGVYLLRGGDGPEDALRRADEALYEAKARGKNNVRHWKPEGTWTPGPARRWSPIIKDALDDDRLELFLQPIVALETEQTAFHEALCRIRTSDGIYTHPALFIADAERLGLMPSIDRRMLERAEQLLAEDPDLSVFINLSPWSLDDDDLVELLGRALGISQGRLGIEITEHASLRDFDNVTQRLNHLRSLGAQVAIDDFGQGFSSFTHLAALPCDLIKIGAETSSLVHDAARTEAILQAVTTVAHAHGKAVVIEGIETADDARRARRLGIEYGQGWHYGEPHRPGLTLGNALSH